MNAFVSVRKLGSRTGWKDGRIHEPIRIVGPLLFARASPECPTILKVIHYLNEMKVRLVRYLPIKF